MSRYATDLCTLLVDENFGQLTSRVFQTLLIHGRCSLAALHHRTQLSYHQLRHSLTVLIQHNLAYWNTSFTNNSTAYEANAAVAYDLIRNGKHVRIIEDKIGIAASKVLSHLLLFGHARVSDLVHAYSLDIGEGAKGKSTTPYEPLNGIALNRLKENGRIYHSNQNPLQDLHLALCDLLQAGFLCTLHESHLRTDADNRTEAERVTRPIEEYKASRKADREAMWEEAIQKTLYDWKHGSTAEIADVARLKRGLKRPLEISETCASMKRPRLEVLSNSNSVAGDHYGNSIEHAESLRDEIVLRISRETFPISLRTHHLVELAEQCTCVVTSRVYAKVLEMMEPQLRKYRNINQSGENKNDHTDSDDPQISTEDIVAAIPKSSELESIFGSVRGDEMKDKDLDHPKKHRRKDGEAKSETVVIDSNSNEEDGEDEDDTDTTSEGDISMISHDEDEDMGDAEYNPLNGNNPQSVRDPHFKAVRSHLQLLAQHPNEFLAQVPRSANTLESWKVRIGTLVKNCQKRAIIQTVVSRYGNPSGRLMNILTERGKLDEKTLSSFSLIREKEMRNRLTTMQKAGLLELQEVPRDNARVASRTHFLFFYDHDRCKSKLLEECYKTVTRLLERARIEKEQVQGTLEKASRSDVIGREEQLLGAAEQAALQKWYDSEAKILGQVSRVDDMVALLRDF